MKRFAPLLACVVGIVALFALLPLFDPPQPRGVRINRERAREIADAEARRLGVDLSQAWGVMNYERHGLLEEQFKKNPDLRRRANDHPIVGPRISAYWVRYFRNGEPKFPFWADVYVDGRDGAVIGARVFAKNDLAAGPLSDADAKRRSDEFLTSRKLPAVANPQFYEIRPQVFRRRVDKVVMYRIPHDFPTGKISMLVAIYFTGDQFSGWMPIEETSDGSNVVGDTSGVTGLFAQYGVVFALMIALLVLFLKKYHAGEVGVRTASFLFGVLCLLSIVAGALIGPAATLGSGIGQGFDGYRTFVALTAFRFIFYDLPVAVLVFFAWAVGESYARERWGERLASFDAILRRDPFNATVGRSILIGLLCAPLVAAATFAVGAIPLVLKLAHATAGATHYLLAAGGPLGPITIAAVDAIRGSVVLLLFVIAFFARKRLLWVGFVIVAVVGSVWQVFNLPIEPATQAYIFGFGGVLIAAAIFLFYDLLAASTALFFGSIVFSFAPALRVLHGDAFSGSMTAFAVPFAIAIVFGLAALATRREVVYTYEDLAPHVKRIIERERVKAEIDAANRIQAALLPLDTPRLAGASVASHYRAATEIGGDYFDFLPQPGGEIGIAFGDVSGHGLTSGIVMAMAKSALMVQVDYDASPRAVLDVLNEIVIRTAPKRIMMTFFFGLLDPRSQSLRFSSAGHLDPYVYRKATKRLESLSCWGYPLGISRRDPFREQSVDFESGDRLILYSDGLIEAVDDDGEPFGFERFEETLRANGHMSADEIKKALLHAVKKFTHNRPPEDDQTLVVVAFEEVTTGTGLRARDAGDLAVSDVVH
jgi:MFS family permease